MTQTPISLENQIRNIIFELFPFSEAQKPLIRVELKSTGQLALLPGIPRKDKFSVSFGEFEKLTGLAEVDVVNEVCVSLKIENTGNDDHKTVIIKSPQSEKGTVTAQFKSDVFEAFKLGTK